VRRLLFIAVGVGILLLALPQYWKRLATIGSVASLVSGEAGPGESPDGAIKRRVTEMFAAVYVFIDHPVIGVGPGMFRTYAEEYGNRGATTLRRIEGDRRAHSLLLEIAAESGALGLTLFLAMLLVTMAGLASARRSLLERDPEIANLATAYLLALVGYVASGVFLHLAYMRYFYLVLALGGAACYVADQALAEEPAAPRATPSPVPGWSSTSALRPGESV
jgi:O-antigen ligase